jgi:hypothetical protein
VGELMLATHAAAESCHIRQMKELQRRFSRLSMYEHDVCHNILVFVYIANM